MCTPVSKTLQSSEPQWKGWGVALAGQWGGMEGHVTCLIQEAEKAQGRTEQRQKASLKLWNIAQPLIRTYSFPV